MMNSKGLNKEKEATRGCYRPAWMRTWRAEPAWKSLEGSDFVCGEHSSVGWNLPVTQEAAGSSPAAPASLSSHCSHFSVLHTIKGIKQSVPMKAVTQKPQP